jgi:flagellar protein FliS
MPAHSALNQYQQVSNHEAVSGASPHRLIQMLMEGALKRMAEAKGAIQRGDLIKKGESIGKAISIIGGLRDSLNMDVEGGLSQQLDRLYSYIVSLLIEANLKRDESYIDEAAQLMITVKSGWDGISSEVS